MKMTGNTDWDKQKFEEIITEYDDDDFIRKWGYVKRNGQEYIIQILLDKNIQSGLKGDKCPNCGSFKDGYIVDGYCRGCHYDKEEDE